MGAGEVMGWLAMGRRVMRHPRVPREALLAYQDERLREMVRHAARKVPFYRDLYGGAGVAAGDFRGREDLAALPRVAASDLRRLRRHALLAEGVDTGRIAVSSTSGSSGNPFGVWRTREEARRVAFFRQRAHRQLGIGLRDRVCTLIEPRGAGRPGLRRRLLRRLGFRRGTGISCFLPLAEIAAELERLAPDAVAGYPTTLARVGSFLSEHGRRRLSPHVVYTGGETLDAGQRRRIEEGFGARVFDVYGVTEVDLVAWECPEVGGLHLCEDNVVPEILKDGRPVAEGEVGQLVITALHNATMPLVRYGLGDLVERGPAPCPCGQPFGTLSRIWGRTVHYLEIPGREAIHPYVITGPLIRNDFRWIDRHQLVQEAPDRIILRIALRAPPPAGALERMERLGHDELGPTVRFRVEFADELPLDPSGKFSPYVSLLERPEEAST